MKLSVIAVLLGTTLAFPGSNLIERSRSCTANKCNKFLNDSFDKAENLCKSLVKSLSIPASTSTKFVTQFTGTSTITTLATTSAGQTTVLATTTQTVTTTALDKRQEGPAGKRAFSSSAVAACGGKLSSVSRACSCLSTSRVKTKTKHLEAQATITSVVTVASATTTQYTTSVVVATATPSSLIQDGDFENGAWGQGWYSQIPLVVTSPGYGGSNYAGLVNITSTSYDIVLTISHQGIPVTQGEQYYTSFNLQILSDQCNLRWWPDGGQEGGFSFGSSGFISPVGQWTQQNFTFVARNNQEQPLLLVDCSQGFTGMALALDNIVMLPVSNTIYSTDDLPTGADLVQNGNFGSGALSPWTQTSRAATFTFESPGYNGDSNALMISFQSDPEQSNFLLSQSLSTVQDTVYLVSAAVKFDNPFDSSNCFLSLLLIDQTSNTFAYAFRATDSNLPNPGEWGIINGVAAAPLSNVPVLVQLLCDNGATNVFHFDDIRVLPIS